MESTDKFIGDDRACASGLVGSFICMLAIRRDLTGELEGVLSILVCKLLDVITVPCKICLRKEKYIGGY